MSSLCRSRRWPSSSARRRAPTLALNLDRMGRASTRSGAISPGGSPAMPDLKLVAEAEAARTSPGSELMVEVFKLAGPSVILLDELTMFARQLDDDRFEAFLSFIQSLTEAAKMAPGVLIVGSLPESDAEAGGERGEAALLRLEKVFGRVQSPWLPASGDETYEIIRRRLFQPLDADGEKARDETVKAFHDLYKKNPAEFPPEAKEARYLGTAAPVLSDPPRAVRSAVEGLGEPRKIPAHARRAALHGECRRRAVAQPDARSADHAGASADRA